MEVYQPVGEFHGCVLWTCAYLECPPTALAPTAGASDRVLCMPFRKWPFVTLTQVPPVYTCSAVTLVTSLYAHHLQHRMQRVFRVVDGKLPYLDVGCGVDPPTIRP